MNYYSRLLFLYLLFAMTALKAEEAPQIPFHSDQLTVNNDDLYVISSFEEIDYLTVYTHAGDPVWEVPFNAKILSWQERDELLFVFSKARNGRTYFVSCLDAKTGNLLWEKGIYSNPPQATGR